jgi:hypothetical protein
MEATTVGEGREGILEERSGCRMTPTEALGFACAALQSDTTWSFADRERGVGQWLIYLIERRVGPEGTVGEAISHEEMDILAKAYHLRVDEKGVRDASQA